ncbi:hypothetical protein ACVWW4_000206 [Bradyrhizobium sp. LB7.1]
MVEDVTLLFILLKASAVCFKLQHGDFLIVAIGAKALLVHRLGKPHASLLHGAGQRHIGIIASCRKGLSRKFEYGVTRADIAPPI